MLHVSMQFLDEVINLLSFVYLILHTYVNYHVHFAEVLKHNVIGNEINKLTTSYMYYSTQYKWSGRLTTRRICISLSCTYYVLQCSYLQCFASVIGRVIPYLKTRLSIYNAFHTFYYLYKVWLIHSTFGLCVWPRLLLLPKTGTHTQTIV